MADSELPDATPVTADFTLTVTDVNEAPTAVTVTDPVASVAESYSVSERIKVGTISITDDALGANSISLAGADAALFEVDGTELFVKAGARLDFETRPLLSVTVVMADTSLTESTPVETVFTLAVTDVEELFLSNASVP